MGFFVYKGMETQLGQYTVSGGMVQRLVGLVASSVLSENEKEECLATIPYLYSEEARVLHEHLMNNQQCPITQMAQFSNKAVDKRLDYVMENERL